ncbi:AAA family ATPase [Paenibacillus spongiae]|uniref:AAA family ATPase n=1 Tax=Paenibacillus spongiae TaxID=2909671 RepID=A0ABY5SA82_9BACL|nr:AAA family ATPase [Paenibacillus spongiae]UVI29695.1 AAA family ATPase [Paenibacillus spongiae]
MFNVCIQCGEYHVEKSIQPINNFEAFAICPHCGHAHRFFRLPLFVVTGASGVGKSTICLALTSKLKDAVVIEGDILWSDSITGNFRELCLRVAKTISLNGKPVVLFGTTIPEEFENCKERRYFSEIHYLALTCDDAVLAERLRARPSWRGFDNEDIINHHLGFNRWNKENINSVTPPMELLNTTNVTVQETAEKVKAWIEDKWKGTLFTNSDHEQ